MDEIGIVAGKTNLRLSNVPEYFDYDRLKLLCEQFGRVLNIELKHDGLAYVKMFSRKESKQLMEGLKNNEIGITVQRCPSTSEIRRKLKEAECLEKLNEIGAVVGRTILRLTHIPGNVNADRLKSLCEPFGKVLNVELKGCGLAYVQMDSKKNCQQVCRGLKANELGITVERCPSISQVMRKPSLYAGLTNIMSASGEMDNPPTETAEDANVDNILNCETAKSAGVGKEPNVKLISCGPSEGEEPEWRRRPAEKKSRLGELRHNGVSSPTVKGKKVWLKNIPENMPVDIVETLCEFYVKVEKVVKNGRCALVELASLTDFEVLLQAFKKNNFGITAEEYKDESGNDTGNKICFKKIPSDMDWRKLKCLCGTYGKVSYIQDTGAFTIVKMETKSGFEKAIEGLKDNRFGFIYEPLEETFETSKTNVSLQSDSHNHKPSKPENMNDAIATPETAKLITTPEVTSVDLNETKPEQYSLMVDWRKICEGNVCITGYSKSNLLWVRSVEKSLNEAYLKIINKANTLGRKSEQLEKLPNCGDLVITDYEDKTLCRAQIVHSIDEQNIIVKFLDIGPLGTKNLKQLRRYPEIDLPKIGNFIYEVQLFQVPDFKLNSEVKKLLNDFIRNSKVFKIFCQKAKPVREFLLKEICNDTNLNKCLLQIESRMKTENEAVTVNSTRISTFPLNTLSGCKKGPVTSNDVTSFTSNSLTNLTQNDKNDSDDGSNNLIGVTQSDMGKKYDNNKNSPRSAPEIKSGLIFTRDIQWDMLPNEEYISVYIADNFFLEYGILSCINLKKLNDVKQFNQEFNDYARTLSEIYTPRVSEICLAFNEDDQRWYRAELIEQLDFEKLTIKFIDLGCVKAVQTQNIRKYPMELMRPCHTSTCIIRGLPQDMDENFMSSLKKLFRVGGKVILDRVETVSHLKLNIVCIDLTCLD